MTRIASVAVIGALIAVGVIHNEAQAATDVVFLNVNLSLNGIKQSGEAGMAKLHLSSQDVIAAIGSDTTNDFSPRAKLLLKIPVGLDAGPSFIVRDIVNRTNVVDFAVPSTILWSVQIGDSVQSSRTNSNGLISATQASIWEFEFQSSKGSFDVQGYTAASLDNRGNQTEKLPDIYPTTASSKVMGTGSDADGNAIVLQGII